MGNHQLPKLSHTYQKCTVFGPDRTRPELRHPRLRSRLCWRRLCTLESACSACRGAREGILRLCEEGSAGLEDWPRGAEEGSWGGHCGGWVDQKDESVS